MNTILGASLFLFGFLLLIGLLTAEDTDDLVQFLKAVVCILVPIGMMMLGLSILTGGI